MKSAILAVLVLGILVWISAKSFDNKFDGAADYAPANTKDNASYVPLHANQSPLPTSASTTTSTINFRGPVGEPYIIGPSSNPPNR